MSRLYLNNGPGYSNIPDGDRIRFWTGSSYAVPSEIRAWNGGAYVSVWSRSNPITATFYPSFTTNLRWNGSTTQYDGPGTSSNDAAADLFIGRFGGSFPYHYVSLLQFNGIPSLEGYGTLAELMATRPVVKGANLRLYRLAGGFSNPSGYIRIGTWTQASAQTLPATNLTGSYMDWDPQAVSDVGGWLHGQNRAFGVYPQTIYDMAAGKSIMISEVTSGHTTSGGTSTAYSRIIGNTTIDLAKLPILTVALDVA